MTDTVQTAIYKMGVDSSAYSRGLQEAAQAGTQFVESAAKVTIATEKVEKATRGAGDGLLQFEARIDKTVAAGLRQQRMLDTIARALEEKRISEERAALLTVKVNATYDQHIAKLKQVQGAIVQSGQGFKLFGQQTTLAAYQVTNAGQQLVDVFVGLASGQRPLTVLIQQVPQLTFALGGLAASLEIVKAGAVGLFTFLTRSPLGLLLTGVTALTAGYLALRDNTDYAKQAQERYDDLQNHTKNTLMDTEKSVYDLADAYDALTDAQRRSEAIDLSAAIRKNQELQDSLLKAAAAQIPSPGVIQTLFPARGYDLFGAFRQASRLQEQFAADKDITQLKLTLNDIGDTYSRRAAEGLGEIEKKFADATEQGRKFQAQLRLLNGTATDEDYIILQTKQDLDEQTRSREKTNREAERAAELLKKGRDAYEDHIASLEDERYQLTLTERERYIYNELLKEEQSQKQTGLILSEKQIDALTREAAATYDARKAKEGQLKLQQELEKAREKEIEAQRRALEKQQQELERAVDRTTDRLTDSFFDFFEKGKSGFQSFKDYAIAALKEIAANALIRPVIQPIVSSVLGGVGGAPTSGTSVRGASGGGLSDLFGFGGGGFSGVLDRFGANYLGFANVSPNFVGPLLPGQTVGTTLGGFLGGAGAGFTAGSFLNSLAGGSSLGGTVGSGVGALAGAALGSVIPGIGTLIGGLIGGAGGGFLGGLFGGQKSVGPVGNANLSIANGRFALGSIGQDNGYDSSGLATQVREVAEKLNEIIDTYGFKVRPDLANWANTAGVFGIAAGNSGSLQARSQDQLFVDVLRSRGLSGTANTGNILLSPGGTYDTVLKNTKATTADALVADLNFAKFIEDAKKAAGALSDVQQGFKDMAAQADKYLEQAKQLGVASAQVYGALQSTFNKSINDAILKIENPLQAALDQFEKDAAARLDYAKKIGGDLVQVEKLTGLERQKIIDQYAQQSNGVLQGAVSDLKQWLDAQKLGATSSLSPYEKFLESQRQFDVLLSTARSGGGTQGLTQAADTLLGFSRDVFGGSTQQFAQRETSVHAVLEQIGRQLGLAGFAGGGSFKVGGTGGTDSQVVAFRASPDERVTIETPGQGDAVLRGIGQQTQILAAELRRVTSEVSAMRADLDRAIKTRMVA